MNGTLAQTLMQWGSDLLISLLSVACGYAVLFLRRNAARLAAETVQIQDQTAAAGLRDAIAQVDDLAERTVNKLEQTAADEMRQMVKDGKIDRKELLALGPKAANEVMGLIGPGLMDILQQHLGDVGTFVLNTVEKKVRDLKQPPSSPAPVNIVVNNPSQTPVSTQLSIPSDSGSGTAATQTAPEPLADDTGIGPSSIEPSSTQANADTPSSTEDGTNATATN